MRGELHYDVVVIGAGTAGLTAGARLAEGGARVCVLAKGVGSTHLAPGTIDVLGYAPDRVEEPGSALAQLARERPDHPYALIGPEAVEPALKWLTDAVAAGPHPGYAYVGGLQRNFLLPTAVGVVRPSAVVPETMAAGDVSKGGSVCIVGPRLQRDFFATLCAANLNGAGFEASAVELSVEMRRPDANTLAFARRLDDPAFRATMVADVAPRLGSAERVGIPAVLGLRDPHGAWQDLQERVGRPVFEIPTLPPSVPGMRLFEALRAALRRAGGRLVLGAEVTSVERDGGRVTAVVTHAAGHDVRYASRWVVLASGGFTSGAIELDSDWVVREKVLGLPVRGAPQPGEPRFAPEYFGEQPMARVGVAVGPGLRAEGAENVFVAGAALPGAAPWREGSGEGIALTSGCRAAELVLAEEGAKAAA